MAEPKETTNLYLIKRKEMGWSREYAAEQIGISDDKLERIENEKQLPNPQDVLIMSNVYQAPELCNYYCHRDCEIGRQYVPEVPKAQLPGIILRLLDSVYAVQDIEKILVRITADDMIDESEVDDLAHAQYTSRRCSSASNVRSIKERFLQKPTKQPTEKLNPENSKLYRQLTHLLTGGSLYYRQDEEILPVFALLNVRTH